MSRSLARLTCSVAAASISLAVLAGCGSDGATEGYSSPRAVVDAHIESSRRYDLHAGCELFTPDRKAQMASFDGDEVEGYCKRATDEVVALADDATRARTRAIYTDPVVTELPGEGGSRFTIAAADGSYQEDVVTVEVDGRWWLADVSGDDADS